MSWQQEDEDYEFNSFYDHRLGVFSPAEEPGYQEDGPMPVDLGDGLVSENLVVEIATYSGQATTIGLTDDEIPF